MKKVFANGTTVAQENWYDAAGRRIAKKEVYAAEPYIYVYDGWDIIGANK